MQRTHHAVTVNGRMTFEIMDSVENARDDLRRMLSRLDGRDRYSIVLWAMPLGKRLDEVDEATEAGEAYIQCAGSSDAMTVEIRVVSDGEATQYVVGRAPQTRSGDPRVDISWDGYVATVYEDEVFDADAATELFVFYLTKGSVAADFALRFLDLRRP